jgi:hypothetical protein
LLLISLLRCSFSLRQRRQIGRSAKLTQLRTGLGEMFGNVFRTQPDFARGALYRRDALFGQFQRLRIEFDTIGIAVQFARGFVQGFRCAFQQRQRFVQSRINCRQIGQAAAQDAQAMQHAGFVGIQRIAGALRAAQQIGSMRQPRVFFLQGLPAVPA